MLNSVFVGLAKKWIFWLCHCVGMWSGQNQMCHLYGSNRNSIFLCDGEKNKTQKVWQCVSAYSLFVCCIVFMFVSTSQNGLLFFVFCVCLLFSVVLRLLITIILTNQ